MKSYMFFLIMIITLGSCGIADNKKSPEQVLSEASKLLDSWETVHYSATTLNNKTTHTNVYNLKKVSYEPHLNLFFSKEIDKEITIYYKLASLKVVEDRKKKITTFEEYKDEYAKSIQNPETFWEEKAKNFPSGLKAKS